MTTEEDDQSTMTCGVQYETSAFNSDSSDEDDDEERKSNGFNDDSSYISYAGDSSKDSRRSQFLTNDNENISDICSNDALCESDSSDDSSHETAL